MGASSVVEGVVSANRGGFGFVRVEGQAENVFLPPREMTGLIHGDKVRISVHEQADGRFSGEVQAVIARGIEAFLGTLSVQGRSAWVTPMDRRIAVPCQVPADALGGARDGEYVIARITRYPNAGVGAQARIEQRLDPNRPNQLACEAAIARYSLPNKFAPEVEREAQDYGASVDPKESERRRDLRNMPLVTIDGADARDFDDAVFAEKSAGGFRLVVAIADVSHYVRSGTALDVAARERGTSVYFPSRVIPMLPAALSDNLCSLAPNVDRLCFAADMQISRTGQLTSAEFYPAVMRSHARLTYVQAYEALFEAKPVARAQLGSLVDKLLPLLDVYQVLAGARARRGALEFESTESIVEFDAEQQVRAIAQYERNDAHKLIEECMVLANVAVAQALGKAKVATLYRVHATPEDKKLEQLRVMLGALGIAAEIPQTVTPLILRQITERFGSGPDRPFLESLVVRAMPQALYQPTNIGHFGLALDAYAHFTSPIRRYPDLVVHRSLKAMVEPKDVSGERYEAPTLSVVGADLSRLEKRADESDRYVETFLKCSYLASHVGEEFDGLITSVVDFGCFVRLSGVDTDGLLHLDALRDDQYVKHEHGQSWIGNRTRRELKIGGVLKVRVTNVNPFEGLIDLELGESPVLAQRIASPRGAVPHATSPRFDERRPQPKAIRSRNEQHRHPNAKSGAQSANSSGRKSSVKQSDSRDASTRNKGAANKGKRGAPSTAKSSGRSFGGATRKAPPRSRIS